MVAVGMSVGVWLGRRLGVGIREYMGLRVGIGIGIWGLFGTREDGEVAV